ncbi:MAG: hypothetical protein K8L97_09825 [Anaerolineae bacterium]|nr:hypothetical protein [Anaerolineae bacterium]
MTSRRVRSSLRQQMIAFDQHFRRELRQEAEAVGAELLEKHRAVVRTWKHKPDFRLVVRVFPTAIVVTVTPRGQHKRLFRWVDKGTKPHIIVARRKPYLRFQRGHQAKTKPIARYNVGNGGRTGPWVSKKQVNHPGTKPRLFTKTFSDAIKPILSQRIERAFRRARKK